MPSTLSIKNVSDDVLERLRERARRNHRSLQGELLSMLDDYVGRSSLSLTELSEQVRRLGLSSGDSTEMAREDRDGG
ncbi:MAG: Arc family DNA-binding protein [Chloroflexi bacterium]|nr:Arc family DNA-binding protein [Chloroflexota bacterium]